MSFLTKKNHVRPRTKHAQNAVNKTILPNNVEAEAGTSEEVTNLRKADGNYDL